jgi:hypothetical protein
MDPDGTAYLDAAERLEAVRAAYRAQLSAEGSGREDALRAVDHGRSVSLVGAAELL